MKHSKYLPALLSWLVLALSSSLSAEDTIFLAEVTLSSDTPAGPTRPLAISDDGRFVLLSSRAPNLIPSQVEGNNAEDLFLYDRTLDHLELITHQAGDPARTANELSTRALLSPDGEWVLFTSRADDLIEGMTGSPYADDVFLWQRSSGQLTLVSHLPGDPLAAAGSSRGVALAADGSAVLFDSEAADLVADVMDTNGKSDVFLFERASGLVRLISAALPGGGGKTSTGNGPSSGVALLAGGTEVLFNSNASNLVLVDGNQSGDGFLWLSTGITRPIAAPYEVDYHARAATPDGKSLLLEIGNSDIGVFDRKSATLELMPQPGQSNQAIAISTDGSRVLFDHEYEAWLYDRKGQSLRWLSAGADPNVVHGGHGLALSEDGRWALFERYNDRVQIGAYPDLFLYDFDADENLLISHDGRGELIPEGAGPSVMSRDARFLAFATHAELEPFLNDRNASFDTFLLEREHQSPVLIDRAAWPGPLATSFYFPSFTSGQSADGNEVLFSGPATLLQPEQPLRDRAAYAYRLDNGHRRLLSPLPGKPDVPAPGWSAPLALADDGRVLLDSSAENLVPGSITHGNRQLYLYSPQELSYRLITKKYDQPGEGFEGDWLDLRFDSALGKVALLGTAAGLVPGSFPEFAAQVVLCSADGGCELLSHDSLDPLLGADDSCSGLNASSDLSRITFESYAGNLVPGLSGNQWNAFRWTEEGGLELLSSAAGAPASEANGSSHVNHISEGGRFVLVTSFATNLVPDLLDANQTTDVFVFDAELGTRELVSASALFPGTTASGASWGQAISQDGRFVLFASSADDLVAGQIDPPSPPSIWSGWDLFLLDRASGQQTLLSHLPGESLKAAGKAPFGFLSRDGSRALILSYGDNLVPGVLDRSIEFGIYYWDSIDNEPQLVSHHFADDKASITLYPSFSPRTFDGSILLVGTFFGDEPSQSDVNGLPDAYLILLPSLFRDGFESGDTSAWK